MLRQLLEDQPRLLAECAVAERLRRLPGIDLHPTLYNSPLIYGPEHAREAMAAIYREYLGIAARNGRPILLTAPTWRLDRSRIAAADVPASIVTDAVDFLLDLRHECHADQPSVFIGGLVGPRNDCYRPDLAPSTDEAEAFHAPQIKELADSGIDFLLAQTLPSVAEAAGIAKLMSRTGKDYLISFCTGTDGRVLDGTLLPDAMEQIDDLFSEDGRPLGYFVNCTHPDFLLSNYRPGELDRLIGIQANGSSRDVTTLNASSATVADPLDKWADSMMKLHYEHGIPILGGCCGTTREHLEALAR